MARISEHEKQEAREYLLNTVGIVPGDKILCNLKHTSRSGMYRVITLHVVKDNELINISWAAAKLLEGWDNNHYGCKASGCGMDMGFHLVYNLGWSLFRGEFACIGEGCPANDHSNKPYPDRVVGSMQHTDSGYSLKYSWM